MCGTWTIAELSRALEDFPVFVQAEALFPRATENLGPLAPAEAGMASAAFGRAGGPADSGAGQRPGSPATGEGGIWYPRSSMGFWAKSETFLPFLSAMLITDN